MIRRILAFLVVLMAFTASGAQAQVPFGTNCTLPANSFGGSGIPTNNVMCSVLNGVQLGMSSTGSYASPATTTNSAGTYYSTPGDRIGAPPATTVNFAKWNFNWFVGGASANDFFSLAIDLNPGAAFTPQLVQTWHGNSFDSSNMGYLGALFNDNTLGQYSFELTQWTDANMTDELQHVGINVEVNADGQPPTTATPEPGTMVLAASGLLGIGGLVRRRRQRAV